MCKVGQALFLFIYVGLYYWNKTVLDPSKWVQTNACTQPIICSLCKPIHLFKIIKNLDLNHSA